MKVFGKAASVVTSDITPGYTSDITRTWPISGTFSPHQLRCRPHQTHQPCTLSTALVMYVIRMYEAVLDTQQKLIQSVEPGSTTIDGLYRKMLVGVVIYWFVNRFV